MKYHLLSNIKAALVAALLSGCVSVKTIDVVIVNAELPHSVAAKLFIIKPEPAGLVGIN